MKRNHLTSNADPVAGLDEALSKLSVNHNRNISIFVSCGYDASGVKEWHMPMPGVSSET